MITVLTPTGDRHRAFKTCVAQMRMQTYNEPVRWVIVDDGQEETPIPDVCGWQIVRLRPKPLWQPGQNTHARNLLAGLERVTDRVVMVEDDDEYATWWLEACDARLDDHDLVGECLSLYRNKQSGTVRHMGNREHASMCSTALKGAAIDKLREICRRQAKGLDMALWKEFTGTKCIYEPEPRGVTGIKGWPGRAGIGVGHRI